MISLRPYNPKAQGKIERSHRKLRNKPHYDMVKLKNKGVNWVENLDNYIQVLMNWHEKNLAGKSLLKCIIEENQILLLKLHIILTKPLLGCLLQANLQV